MPLVYACIAPHGGEIVPALAGKRLASFAPTRSGMRTLARKMKEARPDTIVVASPHNLRLLKHIGVVMSENSSGSVGEGRRQIKLRAKCDKELGKKVLDEAERKGLPVVGANYGGLEGPSSDLAMDWGTLIPLWFLLKGARLRSKVLIVTPSRGIPLSQNFEFGKVVAEIAQGVKQRVAFVASADQAHAHKKSGPYGFNKYARQYDDRVVDAVRSGKLASIMDMDDLLIDGAKPDSLWQMTILAGALSVVPMDGELISYQRPTYFGMICASYYRSSTPTFRFKGSYGGPSGSL
jgi:aromatic ring-opening dioxygenase LigB subunit